MMTANDVIESYVRDVAKYLPRGKRNDVAFELRALLQDEAAAKAASQGRAPDKETVLEILKGFGRPAECAARYQPRPPLIDPADNHNFLIWAVAGSIVAIIVWPHSLSWITWIGGVFLYFAVTAWVRRHWQGDRLGWIPVRKPDAHPSVVVRPFVVLGALATLVFPFSMYLAPQTFADIAFLGQIPTGGLALTEAFLQSWQRLVTLGLLGFAVWLHLAVAWQGGWRAWSRRAGIVAYGLLGLMLVVHSAPLRAPGVEPYAIFQSAAANGVAMPIFGLVGAITVLSALYQAYREWARVEPAPAQSPG
jgi:hypothetical protein